MREFHKIIEFSFNKRQKFFIIRFLDGTCLKSFIKHFPIKFQAKSARWTEAVLGSDEETLIVPTEKRKKLKIPAFVLYSSGRTI